MAQRVSSPVFVGRAAELAQLRAAADRTLTGTSAAVVVTGEAGVGKTRLLGELLDHAQEQGMLTLAGGCLDVGDGVVAYAPVVEALRGLVWLLDPGELDQVLGSARAELTRLVPQLGAATEPAGTLSPGRLFELLLGALHRLVETRPVLLVVEDLHWRTSQPGISSASWSATCAARSCWCSPTAATNCTAATHCGHSSRNWSAAAAPSGWRSAAWAAAS